jgi:hypothetical protein
LKRNQVVTELFAASRERVTVVHKRNPPNLSRRPQPYGTYGRPTS